MEDFEKEIELTAHLDVCIGFHEHARIRILEIMWCHIPSGIMVDTHPLQPSIHQVPLRLCDLCQVPGSSFFHRFEIVSKTQGIYKPDT